MSTIVTNFNQFKPSNKGESDMIADLKGLLEQQYIDNLLRVRYQNLLESEAEIIIAIDNLMGCLYENLLLEPDEKQRTYHPIDLIKFLVYLSQPQTKEEPNIEISLLMGCDVTGRPFLIKKGDHKVTLTRKEAILLRDNLDLLIARSSPFTPVY